MLNKLVNWLMSSDPETVFKAFFKIWIVWVVIVLCGIAGLTYVGIHFLMKYW